MTISRLLWSIDDPLPFDQGHPQQLSAAQGPIERCGNANVIDASNPRTQTILCRIVIAAVPERAIGRK
jgi:hypothetical protein